MTPAQVTDGGGVQPALSYGYDAIGNITSKSDMGSYSYSGTGPHAVTSISGSNPGTYSYDADGNMTNRNGTAITWNSDNLPTCITAGGTCSGGGNWSAFNYAPDKHRYYQSAMIAGVSETTVYVGAFEAVTTGGVTKYRYHLSAGSREVAEVDLSNSGSTVSETVSYILSDHLGSVDVVRTYNAATGALISTTNMSFSAWGGRREPNTWLPPVSISEAQADHAADRYGFTHQEMLDNVGIIHMNGRVYDPNLGRFLSVDPVFEFPTNTQSLNPYSYVLNNPLSLTDPTGYAASCSSTSTDGAACAQETHVSYTPTGSHIAVSGTLTATPTGNGNFSVTGSNAGVAQAFNSGAKAMFGNGEQNGNEGTGDGIRNSSATPNGQATTTQVASVTKGNANDATGGVSNTPQNINDLGSIVTSEASTRPQVEQQAVADTAVNFMDLHGLKNFSDLFKSKWKNTFAHNQKPGKEELKLVRKVISGTLSDITHGATHFYTPIAMPAEGYSTRGFDVGGGLEQTDGLPYKNYRPSWANDPTHFTLRNIAGVDPAWFKFYGRPLPKPPGNQ